MIDSIFIENSPILHWFKMRQEEIRGSYKNNDKIRFSKKTGLEIFL